MRLKLCISCLIVLLPQFCVAQQAINVRLEWVDDSHRIARSYVDEAGHELAATDWYYDNFRDPVRGGVSSRAGVRRVGGDEFGDDLMSAVGGGRLRGERFTMSNLGTNGVCTYLTQLNRWYDSEGVLLREFLFDIDVSLSNLGPGVTLNFRADDGFWDFLNLVLPSSVFVSHQWSNPVGMDINDFGQAIAGPRTIGYSSQYIRNFTAGQDIDLGSDQLNLCLALRVDPVPAPSAASFVGAVSLLVVRRRR